MNTNNIKRYAPKARCAFIAAMTKQAAKYGITSKGIEPLERKGDLALISDRPFPASMIFPRAALVKKVEQMGFAQAMEQAAYSWFNRLCAIRFMEIKGYLDHGRRVLSHPEREGSFQILDDCLDIELEGLDRQRITDLKLDGTKDEELYRELLLTQCHALHQAMPFLFEAIDDATELLLPDNLTKTDSLIRELVSAIPEEDWREVEIIGWLYQFYISEKKDQVIGKVVRSEDIPAATQLFTPNWIVQYLVQNSVGRQWLQTYPDSPLRAKMPYYIEPAEQTSEVQAQLAAITPDSIDPLSIKVLDPACGSGHILVEAYKVLKEIYTERGFRARDIPQLILENNLFGLDIDDRAGQLSGFALMMLAREDDRRIFSRLAENGFKLNVLPLQESSHLDFASLWKALNLTGDWQRGQSQGLFDSEQANLGTAGTDPRYQLLKSTLACFSKAKTFGSLIEVPLEDTEPLSELLEQLRQLGSAGDSMQKPAAEQLIPFVQQAWMLASKYDAVIANPPYLSSKGMAPELKFFAEKRFPKSKADLFAAFIERGFNLLKPNGSNAQVTLQTWMFLSGLSEFREWIICESRINSLLHIGYNSFPELNSKIVQCAALISGRKKIEGHFGVYIDLNKAPQSSNKRDVFINRNEELNHTVRQDDFFAVPGSPIAYWISDKLRQTFKSSQSIEHCAPVRQGFQTGDNDKFLRLWHEVDFSLLALDAEKKEDVWKNNRKWVPYNKGGEFRKWFGNNDYVVAFDRENYALLSKLGNCLPSRNLYFKKSITWSALTSSHFGARLSPKGFTFSAKGACAFPHSEGEFSLVCSLLNSKVASKCLEFLAPTLDFNVGDIRKIPICVSQSSREIIYENFEEIQKISQSDWNSYETSWLFRGSPLLKEGFTRASNAFNELIKHERDSAIRLKHLEEKNNTLLAKDYGLTDEVISDVGDDLITLNSNPAYRYGRNQDQQSLTMRYQSETLAELVSYAIGCIMGRYSLDREGLVYAHASNLSFTELVAEGVYKTFPADSDGILPLTDQEWFADDATNRFNEFIRTAWGEKHRQENLDFVAESLCLSAIKPKRGESALDCIRRYLSTQLYKDHLKTYKKRPIYWLFSSGKYKAFECLVYLHRYNEGTLARMRTEYVIPLTAKLNSYANKLEQDIDASTSTAEKKPLEKELDALHRQQAELATFDEKLRHFADLRISLDLDDGVKENYGKFGDLLAEVKAVTGEKAE
ncbi:BREX-1 system adenine-specific DNA-methyltransferase PglX [Cupriavidus sp. UYPR2.512]|uniref:BREX-1 system adenine-specific DNA-methyltransferase PglX n=1 Tax=Cupriavidus sp. UYPR2.512 TaxID=1080187 RepID=UPI00036EC8AA|nr:BREX-1 system adenine-specific DNA-methyltransferase PglX [Cupriavidus sp. UYPR2.512]UIF86259.1 BREX-1 system adenine-specific DNA-methyltransferase PglX [Cupriavidus necator]